MTRLTTTAVAMLAVVAAIAASPASAGAQGRGHHGAAPVHVKPPTHAPHGNGKSGTEHGRSGGQHGQSGAPHGKPTPAQQLQTKPQLSQKLAALLPAGTNMGTAADGFKNLGQFVAAVHVSHNLDVPFDQLKNLMTGPDQESLGKAVKTLRPDASKDAVKQAEDQAKKDIGEAKSEGSK